MSRELEPEENTCDVCGKYAYGIDFMGSFICFRCMEKDREETDREEEG